MERKYRIYIVKTILYMSANMIQTIYKDIN